MGGVEGRGGWNKKNLCSHFDCSRLLYVCMYVENVYNGFIYNLAHHRMSAIIRYLWARKYRAVVVSYGVPHEMDPVDVGLLCLGEK